MLGHDVAGGLGSTVIQLAKHLGATVATTASANNAEFVRSLGADIVVDYIKTFPFVQTFEALAHVEHGHANGKTIIALD